MPSYTIYVCPGCGQQYLGDSPSPEREPWCYHGSEDQPPLEPGVAPDPKLIQRMERLEVVPKQLADNLARAAADYYREFDHLIGSPLFNSYPERLSLPSELAAYKRFTGGDAHDDTPTNPEEKL